MRSNTTFIRFSREDRGQFSRTYKTGRKKIAEARQSPRDESFGTDFTNKCRRLNAGMSQDGSLSLNHRLPAAFLPPRPAVLLLPLRGRRFQLPSSSRRLVLPFLAPPLFRGASPPPLADANRKQERKRKAHSNWQHRQFATCLRSLPLLSPLERRLRQRQSNPPRNSPTYRSDAISMTGDVQALIRCTGFLRSGRSKNYIFIVNIRIIIFDDWLDFKILGKLIFCGITFYSAVQSIDCSVFFVCERWVNHF